MRMSNRSGISKIVLIADDDVWDTRLKLEVTAGLKTLGIVASSVDTKIHKLWGMGTSRQQGRVRVLRATGLPSMNYWMASMLRQPVPTS
jgi:hypothetical protein